LVGNRISPGNPVTKPDGTVVRTLWGELAWQLGGGRALAAVKADDERATSPGDALRMLFNDYGPCLVLIDEWVAYARQLHDQSDLPAGSFETQFTFAQALTESARAAKNCFVVISLPASDSGASAHTQADGVEVGGQRGREALARLANVVGRVETSWRPTSAEEGFEIVRRRLFEPMTDPAQFKDRDVTARAFADLYRTQQQEFPPECRDSDYETRLKSAYPIHPEIFDRLYGDWSTLVKFQRTRGVLRLMAAVIHSRWEKGDRNPLILPANISIDDPRVQFELLSLGKLGAGHRQGRRRPRFAAVADRQRNSEPRQARGMSARRAHDLFGIGANGRGGASRHRGPAHQARLRDARGGAARLW
jgi:predicted AAA+ superfamily ATPase